jgi:Ca2+-binding EF-hand superfamily protein
MSRTDQREVPFSAGEIIMSRTFVCSLALAALCVVGQAAIAQEPRPQRDAGIFDRLDSNKDGSITSDEVAEERKSFFERLLRTGDKDKDGKLTREEFAAANQDERPRRPDGDQPGAPRRPEGAPPIDPERAFRFMDRNGDGKVTADELPEERREMFKNNISRADKDGDGAINLEEFKGSMEALARLMGRGPMPGGLGGPPNLANAPFFRAIDANGDGKLSGDELAKAGDALKTLDRNKDGALTPEELAPPGGPFGRPGEPGTPPADGAARAMLDRLKQADTNGDGKLSKDEAPERLKENFDRIDANSDGFIDQSEAARLFGRLQQNRPQDGNPPRRRPQQENKDNKDN